MRHRVVPPPGHPHRRERHPAPRRRQHGRPRRLEAPLHPAPDGAAGPALPALPPAAVPAAAQLPHPRPHPAPRGPPRPHGPVVRVRAPHRRALPQRLHPVLHPGGHRHLRRRAELPRRRVAGARLAPQRDRRLPARPAPLLRLPGRARAAVRAPLPQRK
ncbi:hypothetical protein PVAP13_9NG333073 [Panicum virgatum]|uniref:Uncharacterized protein n=1 Tax=Panicum virgatum TaxID=38727 RepID=A0A8T0MSP9_PANVG|nr:hypothetical protein PVAP13_9NG333073 [Panicum virgatum]